MIRYRAINSIPRIVYSKLRPDKIFENSEYFYIGAIRRYIGINTEVYTFYNFVYNSVSINVL
jgi:hypothetical protein